LGAQGNVWTEYMQTEKQVEYMAYPRAVALSEVLWSSPKHKNYSDFINRLEQYQKRLDLLEVNYANHIYSVKGKLTHLSDRLTFELNTTSSSYPIYYSTDRSFPSKLYSTPITIDTSMHIKAVVLDSIKTALGAIFEQEINLHKGVGATIAIDKEPHPAYNAGGKGALINGISGNNKRYGDREWLGFSGEDIEITIEFDKPTNINSIATRFFNGNGQWIYPPKKVTVYINNDIRTYVADVSSTNDLTAKFAVKFKSTTVTSIRLKIPSYGIIPEGKQGAGHKPWTFIDEIIIK
jgi:hexosaminidase